MHFRAVQADFSHKDWKLQEELFNCRQILYVNGRIKLTVSELCPFKKPLQMEGFFAASRSVVDLPGIEPGCPE